MTSLSRSDAGRQEGFTLLELIVVMAIVGLLTAIAIPSYQYVMTDNRMAGEVNDLLAAMQYARAEAIKEGNNVVVCASSSGTACSGAATWQSGWLVFSDPDNNGTLEAGEPVLKFHNAFTGGDTFVSADNSTSAVQFSRDGFAVGLANAGVNMRLHNSSGDSTYSRCLDVSIVGALTTVQYGAALAGAGTCQ